METKGDALICRGDVLDDSMGATTCLDDIGTDGRTEGSAGSDAANVEGAESFPEGGFGWVAVLATFSGAGNALLGFVGTLTTSGVDLYAPISGALAEHFGYSVVAVIGAGLLFLGQFVASLAGPQDIWMLFLGGIMAGVGYSGCVAPAIAIPSHWFQHHLDLALGIGVSGFGAGGVVITPLTQWLVDRYGLFCPFLYIPQQVQDYSHDLGSVAISGAVCLVMYNVAYLAGQLVSSVVVGRIGAYNGLVGS
ncbi:hypothetical protein HDU93_002159, partial [Gonapodya sp. JEL0774]